MWLRARIRLRFHASVTRAHSPFTLSRPCRLKWQNPIAGFDVAEHRLRRLLAQYPRDSGHPGSPLARCRPNTASIGLGRTSAAMWPPRPPSFAGGSYWPLTMPLLGRGIRVSCRSWCLDRCCLDLSFGALVSASAGSGSVRSARLFSWWPISGGSIKLFHWGFWLDP